jgi:hypothetical protein
VGYGEGIAGRPHAAGPDGPAMSQISVRLSGHPERGWLSNCAASRSRCVGGRGAIGLNVAIPGRVTMHRIPGIIRERGSGVLHGQTRDSTDRPVVLFTKI